MCYEVKLKRFDFIHIIFSTFKVEYNFVYAPAHTCCILINLKFSQLIFIYFRIPEYLLNPSLRPISSQHQTISTRRRSSNRAATSALPLPSPLFLCLTNTALVFRYFTAYVDPVIPGGVKISQLRAQSSPLHMTLPGKNRAADQLDFRIVRTVRTKTKKGGKGSGSYFVYTFLSRGLQLVTVRGPPL